MNNKIKHTFLLVLLMMFLGIGTVAAQNQAIVGQELIQFKDEVIDLDLTIPVVYLDDWLQMDYLNSMLRYQQMRVAHGVSSEATQHDITHPYSVISQFEVKYNKDNYLSIVTKIYQYTGGAHGITAQIAMNRNLATGKKIQLDNQYYDLIIEEINRQVAQEPTIYFQSELPIEYFDLENFYLTDEGIVIFYGLYEIAPYSSGIREFLIPWSLLE